MKNINNIVLKIKNKLNSNQNKKLNVNNVVNIPTTNISKDISKPRSVKILKHISILYLIE